MMLSVRRLMPVTLEVYRDDSFQCSKPAGAVVTPHNRAGWHFPRPFR
jgi:hypothetical protein